MKYQIKNIIIPQNKRKEINEKCLYVVENGLSNLTQSDIFNAYTGIGGLHDLEYKDYNSRYSYGEAKKEIEQGQFFTPHSICKFMVDCVKPTKTDLISDLCYGMGNFFNYLPIEKNVYGCELDMKAYKITKHLYPDANITADDIRQYNPEIKFDIVFGNPPFGLKWSMGKDEYNSEIFYIKKSFDLLKTAGFLALIVPYSFLQDDFSDRGKRELVDNMFNLIIQIEIPKDAFKNVGVENYSTKIMIFQKKSQFI
jgi:type I restriction-modification system DNA methylase subunit